MKNLLLFSMWIFCCSVSYSQSDYQVSLTGQRINIPINQIWIEEIIDVRTEKSTIGFVQKGISNSMRNATFEKPFERELKDFINSNLKLSENPLLVALRIHHFHISEETRFSSEFAYAEISADLLVKKGESYYFVKQLEAKTQVKGMDVTSKHPKNIAAAFEEIFANVNSDEIKNRLAKSAPIHRDSLEISSLTVTNSKILEKYQFPFLTENMKDGFYSSFYDFRDNKPSDGPNIYLLKKNKSKENEVTEVIPYYSESNKKLKNDYWGFCLNDTVYIQADKKYFPVEFDGNSYTFYAYRGSDPNYYNPSAGAAATAGLLGGAIGGAIAGAAIQSDYNKPVKYTIDPFTGNFTGKPLSDFSQSEAFDQKSKLVIVRYPKGQIEESVAITINDTTSVRLGINEYSEFEFNGPFSPTQLCPELASAECVTYVPQPDDTKYFTVTYDLRKGTSRIKIVEIADDIGQDFVNRAKRQTKKASNK